MRMTNDERGMILLTVLILMFIATLLGTIALNNATVEMQIAGYAKRASSAFEGAEAGINIAEPIIEDTQANSALIIKTITVSGVAGKIDASTLENEILTDELAHNVDSIREDDPNYAPDISIPKVGDVKVNVDIDRLFSEKLPGGAQGFAMGYEGVGQGAHGGGIAIYYRINSSGTK